jgi:hypothetical protein
LYGMVYCGCKSKPKMMPYNQLECRKTDLFNNALVTPEKLNRRTVRRVE